MAAVIGTYLVGEHYWRQLDILMNPALEWNEILTSFGQIGLVLLTLATVAALWLGWGLVPPPDIEEFYYPLATMVFAFVHFLLVMAAHAWWIGGTNDADRWLADLPRWDWLNQSVPLAVLAFASLMIALYTFALVDGIATHAEKQRRQEEEANAQKIANHDSETKELKAQHKRELDGMTQTKDTWKDLADSYIKQRDGYWSERDKANKRIKELEEQATQTTEANQRALDAANALLTIEAEARRKVELELAAERKSAREGRSDRAQQIAEMTADNLRSVLELPAPEAARVMLPATAEGPLVVLPVIDMNTGLVVGDLVKLKAGDVWKQCVAGAESVPGETAQKLLDALYQRRGQRVAASQADELLLGASKETARKALQRLHRDDKTNLSLIRRDELGYYMPALGTK